MDITTVDGQPRTDTKQATPPAGGSSLVSVTPESEFSAFLHNKTQMAGTDSLRTKLVHSADTAATDHSVTKSIVSHKNYEHEENRQHHNQEHDHAGKGSRSTVEADTTSPHTQEDHRAFEGSSNEAYQDHAVSHEAKSVDAVGNVAAPSNPSHTASAPKIIDPKHIKKILHADGAPSEKVLAEGIRAHLPKSKQAGAHSSEVAPEKISKKQRANQNSTFRTANPEQSDGLEKAAGTAQEANLKVTVKTDHRADPLQTRSSEAPGSTRSDGSQSGLSSSGNSAQNKAGKDNGSSAQGQARGDNSSQGSSTTNTPATSPIAGSGTALGTSATFRSAVDAASGQTTETSSSVKGANVTSSVDPQHGTKESVRTQKPARPAQTSQTREQTPVEQIRIKITKGIKNGDTIRIQLRPETLGKVDVRLEVHDGRVSAYVVTDTRETLDLLKNDMRSLERALNEAGLKTDQGSLNFSLRGEGQSNHAQQKEQDERASPSTPYDAQAQNLDDDLIEEASLEARRAAAAQARGGVDVQI